ncbi:hypothetical protein Patl1_27155 [Pistacia atlantica]|uniref:Uncharacterized protein n=1 Tax=Pistacia atlantica TaxID=434234 RepID=A0ACC1B1A0_9ROSI|nr:hypothetical protein Patl1_27155 [Pistacia atlantica]
MIFACQVITGRRNSLQKYFYSIPSSNKFSRFVQFGADQDCHCGAIGCRRKLGVKPSKPKISSDATLKFVACQIYQNGGLHTGSSQSAQNRVCPQCCIGKVIRLSRPPESYFGIIRRFDKYSRQHTVSYSFLWLLLYIIRA